MKKHYLLLIPCLLLSLFIYLFYRTEKTVVNELFMWLTSPELYFKVRAQITELIPLQEHIIYSLPEALWVFCITLTSKFLFVKIGKHRVNLVFAPLFFVIGLEFFQLFHLTNGRFDFWDIGLSILSWSIANYFVKSEVDKQNLLAPINGRSMTCLLSYLIVYLAHVWR